MSKLHKLFVKLLLKKYHYDDTTLGRKILLKLRDATIFIKQYTLVHVRTIYYR